MAITPQQYSDLLETQGKVQVLQGSLNKLKSIANKLVARSNPNDVLGRDMTIETIQEVQDGEWANVKAEMQALFGDLP